MTPTNIEALEKVRDALLELCAINKGAGYEVLNRKGREALSLLPDLIASAKDGGWLPIKSAPKDGTPFIGYSPLHGVKRNVSWCKPFERFDENGYSGLRSDYTHWMPQAELPTPPKPEQPE